MEFKLLRTFVTVAKLGNLTKAAEVLHVSQPTVSGQLKNMEDLLGLRLFERSTSSVTLTQGGIELLPKAERTLECISQFLNCARSLRGEIDGKLRIGVVMLDPQLLRLGEFTREMVARHKGLSIELQAARIGLFVEGIRCGDLDAAFYTGSAFPSDMCGIELRKITFRVVAPALWRRRLEGATWSDTALMPWIRTTKPSAHHEMVTSILEQLSIKPVEIVEADHELIVRALIVAGLGIGLLREDIALEAQETGEVIILGEERTHTTLSFIYLSNRAQDPSIRATTRVLREIWELEGGESSPATSQ